MHHAGRRLRFATTRLATGPQVHYAEQGDPGGEPIVFVHPHADSWFSFSRVLSLLPGRCHAYALDQRGHGDSERPDCCYTIDDFAADAVAFLDGVGVGRATLVGHSASGFIARRVAETHPDRVARLVLINCAVSLPPQVRREMQAALRELRTRCRWGSCESCMQAWPTCPCPSPSSSGWWPRVSRRPPASGETGWRACWGSTTRLTWGGLWRRRCCCGGSGTGCSRGRSRSAWQPRFPVPGCKRSPGRADH
jgi:pimeloyl-ACP methyl ester carboxylesterase